ncbi:uncharacterized protein K452DRAFT_353837 [Aplosporella prunicola CBS 121167]|uniref:Amine oxidase domain-containing protein n=1 Tax=Aplosporella prunicola CBS 121167 TaxID=1176127 RepID=A0A6A6AXK4_9PEZI|nr:uncharacterized protein K452DRAFT_353837 [Aplosporella prunicola CBS 121167]KAF2136669.1 hypothetical protein K452DRAFT_353837 [Aplosporella prunicola CBS 121167]
MSDSNFSEHSDCTSNWVTRDVAIIGGGASGTYAAWRLRELNYSVAIIEKKARLGGHTETYITPQGVPIDYGVMVYHNWPLVERFFEHFGIPLTEFSYAADQGTSIDLRTGEVDKNYTQPDPSLALQAYGAQLAKYPYLREGFNLPDPVPEDLLIPFGAFVEKYRLDDAVWLIAQYSQGFGDILAVPTLYVAKYFGLELLDALQEEATIARFTAAGKKSFKAMYGTSLRFLIVRGPKNTTHLRAKQLLITAPPSYNAVVEPLCPSARERALFSRFRSNTYWAGVMHASGLPSTSVRNAAPEQPFHLPRLPSVYGWSPAQGAPGYFSFTYGGPQGQCLSDEAVKADVLATVERTLKAGSLEGGAENGTEAVSLVAFSNHSPYEFMVGVEDVRAGFYRDLKALQGHWDTWWTGAAFEAHDSSLVWRFTEGLLGNITERLGN